MKIRYEYTTKAGHNFLGQYNVGSGIMIYGLVFKPDPAEAPGQLVALWKLKSLKTQNSKQ